MVEALKAPNPGEQLVGVRLGDQVLVLGQVELHLRVLDPQRDYPALRARDLMGGEPVSLLLEGRQSLVQRAVATTSCSWLSTGDRTAIGSCWCYSS